jgi:hypothetical protein
MMKKKFDEDERLVVVELYSQVDSAVDQLPYTEQFDWLYDEFCKMAGEPIKKSHFFRLLTNLRKTKGGLPRKPR